MNAKDLAERIELVIVNDGPMSDIESIISAALAEKDAVIARFNALLDEVEQALINNDLRKTAKAVADERLKPIPAAEKEES